MQALNTFAFDSAAVRVLAQDGEPWFVAADVAGILGYKHTPSMVRMLDDDEAAVQNVHSRSGNGVEQDREVTIISESGLYACILKSRRAEAKRFRKWVTGEVLPSIRKTGAYVDPAAPGALGVRAQPMPYLSHVADFQVAADRVFRAIMRSARSAGMPLPVALRRASAVTLERTGIDMLAELNAGEHLNQLEAQAVEQAQAQSGLVHPTAALFYADWSSGQIEELPYQTCLAAQAYQAYTHWCGLAREGEIARRETFTTTVLRESALSGHPAQVKPMRIGERGRDCTERVLLVSPPPLEAQGAWATGLVQRFAECLRLFLAIKRGGASSGKVSYPDETKQALKP